MNPKRLWTAVLLSLCVAFAVHAGEVCNHNRTERAADEASRPAMQFAEEPIPD